GSKEVIEQARMLRQTLGGAMHRPAWLAAAGIIALRDMPRQCREDHRKARLIAELLSAVPGIAVDLEQVQTNTIQFDVTDPRWNAERLVAELAKRKIRVGSRGERSMRCMAHHSIGEAEIGIFIDELRDILR